MRLMTTLLAASVLSWTVGFHETVLAQNAQELSTSAAKAPYKPETAKICALIADAAKKYGIPKNFFARLIWKESRFDHLAVSPVGAQGIAQFMPATAKERGLTDAFNIEQALPASASYLNDLYNSLGNWGLAAAAYNSGPTRLSKWIKSGGFLPLETEDYVLSITGKPIDYFLTAKELTDTALDENLTFQLACERLPILKFRAVSMAQLHPYPWAVQVAGNFRRSAVTAQWNRLRKQNPKLFEGHEVFVSRVRSPLGRKGIYVARIGVHNRQNAEQLCTKIRIGGGSCIIRKNR